MLKLRATGQSILLDVKVVPGASRTRYLGPWNGRARFAVAAPPEKGKANDALVEYLAEILGISVRCVCVVQGHTTPLKTVQISGMSADSVRDKLNSIKA